MADYEGRYEGNGGAYHENGGGSASSPPRSGGFDDLGGSRSQYGSHECGRGSSSNSRGYERGSSKSRGYERGSSKGRDMEKEKERDRDWDRDRDRGRDWERDRKHDHHHKDHRGRSERRGSDWGTIDDHDHHRSQSHIRHRDSDGDRDVHRKHGSRSFSESRSHRRPRSRSRSRSRSKSKRTSGFDLAPPGNVLEPVAASAAGSGMMGATPAAFPGMFPNMLQVTNPLMSVMYPGSQQATRHARRVYVGGLSPTANEQSVAAFFSQAMSAIGGNSGGPGDTVVNVYINHEKKFAFVEMRNADEASNAMALDGIIFEGAPVKVRRPSDYNANQAAYLGRSQPDPNLNLAAVGLSPGSAGGLLEGPDRIFVGGLPYYFTEAQIRELLESFGPLRGFDLVKDRETGNSKGYAFCVYQDLSVTDIACAALNGIKMGDKTLTVRRANQGAVQPRPEQESILDHVRQQVAFQKLVYHSGPLPTKVVCLTQAVIVDELKDDEEYGDIMEDMREEGGRYGKLANVVIPRPGPNGEPAPGVGKVFLEFADTDGSSNARQRLDGRKFDGREVSAIFYPEDKFAQGEYES